MQHSFFFKISKEEKPWLFEIHNKQNSKNTNKIVATSVLDITKFYLPLNRPVTYGLILNGLTTAKLLIEIKFMSTPFINNPEGIAHIEFITVLFWMPFKI